MWKILISLVLFGHGFAQLVGFADSWTQRNVGFRKKSWTYSSDIYPRSNIGKLFGLLWLFSFVMYLVGGVHVWMNSELWLFYSFLGAVVAFFAGVSWWNNLPGGVKMGMLIDVVIIMIYLTSLKVYIASLIT